MALVVTVNEYNTVSETKTADITDIAFASIDDADQTPATYPITAGDNSFSKYLKFEWTGMASEGLSQIQNPRVYKSAGAYKTGEGLTYNGSSITFATPSESSTGDSAIPTSLPGSQNLDLSGSGSGVLTSDGESNYCRMQRTTTGSTPAGALNTLTITIVYDVI